MSHWPRMVEIPTLTDHDPEVRKEAQICTVPVQSEFLEYFMMRYSSWWKLKRTVPWLLRYKAYLLLKIQLSKKNAPIACESQVEASEMLFGKCSYLKVAELQEAEKEFLKRVQQVSFPEVTEMLSSTESCDASGCVKRVLRKAGNSLHQLNPPLKGDLLRVGGRLARAPVPCEKKHPIIFPYKHHVTDLIIKQYHESLGHMGQECVL